MCCPQKAVILKPLVVTTHLAKLLVQSCSEISPCEAHGGDIPAWTRILEVTWYPLGTGKAGWGSLMGTKEGSEQAPALGDGGGCSAHPQPIPALHHEKGTGKRRTGPDCALLFWSEGLEKVGSPDVPVPSLIHSAIFVISVSCVLEIPSNINGLGFPHE